MSLDTLFVIDTETTGLDPLTAGVVEIGCVAIQGARVVEEWASYVWPGMAKLALPTHREVLNISGISPIRLLDAPDLEEALWVLDLWMGQIDPDNRVAYQCMSFNTPFDSAFLASAARLDWVDCVMGRSRAAMRYTGRYGPSLARTCEWLGIERDTAHRALADARDAARVWLALDGMAK